MISNACKYGIRAIVFVASRKEENNKFSVGEIAAEVDAPLAFTGKILQNLSKHNIISSLKGPYGGFYVTNEQLAQPVINAVRSIDGLSVFRECGLGLKQCSEIHPCPMHDQYKIIRESLLESFQNTSIAELAAAVNAGSSFINNIPSVCDE